MKPKKFNHLILPALLLSTGMSNAAVIVYAGSQLNIDSKADDGVAYGWHTTGTGVSTSTGASNVKPLDIDGDNALGSDGWIRPVNGTNGINNPPRFLPSYIVPYTGGGVGNTGATAVLTGNANSATGTSAGFYDTPATGALNLNPSPEANAAAWHASTANNVNLFAFTIQNVNLLAGEILRVGVLFDAANADPGANATQSMAITQTVGLGSGFATSGQIAYRADGLDVVFFDLTGLANGDKFVISADADGTNARSHIAGVTFDSAIPEPSTALLSGIGMLMLLRRRR